MAQANLPGGQTPPPEVLPNVAFYGEEVEPGGRAARGAGWGPRACRERRPGVARAGLLGHWR